MMNQAQALYTLQRIDLELAQKQARLAEIEQALGRNEEVITAERQLHEAEAALSPWRVKGVDLELEIKTVTSKIAATEDRLYSGAVSNPKELQDMQEEIASLKRRRQKLEDDLLEAMIAIEAGQSACNEATQQLAAVQARWEADQGDLGVEKRTLQEALGSLKEQRISALQQVAPESLDIYTRLVKPKRGQVVAALIEGGMCGVCGESQTTTAVQQVRQGRALVYCANCGRILILL